MFGANLRYLAARYPSVAALCRDLDINRTQFNRYLAGDSFPRPDVLHRICSFFGVDARILLEPVAILDAPTAALLAHPFIDPCFGAAATDVPDTTLPSGFYRFSRRSFTDDSRFIQGLVLVSRLAGSTFVRGYEARVAMAEQGMPLDATTREFRGFAMVQEDGVALLIARRGANTGSFNFLARVPAFQNNFWEGYVTRTTRESLNSQRVTRMVYEHLGPGLGQDRSRVMQAARAAGYCGIADLLPFHRRLLRPDAAFR
jgi:transcriptional regulator with XRE-family HTH domain